MRAAIRLNVSVQPFLFVSAGYVSMTVGLIWITAVIHGVSFKAACILCLRVAHGHGRKNLIFSSAFISPVQTSFFSRVSRAWLHTVHGILYNERSQISPCCMKALYHNCVFSSINRRSAGDSVGVKMMSQRNSGSASIPTLTGKQSNWFSMASCRTVRCHISSLNADHSQCLPNRQARHL